jgi:hypothetical protein
VEQRLCDLENGYERFKLVQQWTQLANIVFSLIPLVGGYIACGIADASSAFDGMQISNMVESLPSFATGSQESSTAPLFNRFLSCGNDLVSEHGLAVMPVDARVLLEKVAFEFGVSMQGMRQILIETAQRMVGDRENGGPPVAVVLFGESGDKVEDRENAESSTGSLDGRDMEVLKDQFDASIHERLSALVTSDAVDASTPDAACDSTCAEGARVGGHSNSEGAYLEAVIFLLEVDECGTGAQRFSTALNTLRERSISAELVHMMDHTELAVSMAAHTVMYEQVRLPQFVKLRRCLLDTFIDVPVYGSLLVGDHAIPSDKLFNLIMNDLTSSNVSRSMAGHEVTLRRFIDLVHRGNRK